MKTSLKEQMTEEQYLADNAQHCPRCHSWDIEGSIPQVEGLVAWQDVKCNHCGFKWQDTFRMNGYTTEFSEQDT